MQLTNSYYWFKEVITPEMCDDIIKLGVEKIAKQKAKGESTEAHTYGSQEKGAKLGAMPQGEYTKEQLKEQGVKDTYVRDSEVTWLNEPWIYEKLNYYIHEANKCAGWNFQWDYSEPTQFTTYTPNGFYSWHKDGGSDANSIYKRYIHGVTPTPPISNDRLPEGYVVNSKMVGKIRKLSMTLNLSLPDSYDGGNLKFDLGPNSVERFHECKEARSQGSIVVFPSFIDHCVTPVTRGVRYSLVIWSLGYPFK